MANVITNQAMVELHLQNKSNAINHFLNEQIRDAVEAIEGEPLSDLLISTHGHIKQYSCGTREFYWKDKLVVTVGMRMDKQDNLEIYADHNYGEYFSTTLDEADAKIDGEETDDE